MQFRDFAIRNAVYPAGMLMRRHDHPWTNVTAVIRGEIVEETDTAEHRGRSCSVVVKPAGTMHANRAIGPGPVTTIAIELRQGSELARLAAASPWSWFEGTETARAALDLQRAIRTADGVERTAQALLAMVLTPRSPAQAPAWLGEMLVEIGRGPDRPVCLQELAQRAGLHPVYVSRAFRRFTGSTLTRRLQEVRLGRARHLLSTTERPLFAVAAECGFSDASHLSRVFARAHALTPGHFRRICNAGG